MYQGIGVPAGRGAVLSLVLSFATTAAWADVTGRVFSDAGPLGGATIHLYAREISSARAERLMAGRARAPLATARSAANGSFGFAGGSGAVDLAVRADGFAPSFIMAVSGEAATVLLVPARSRRGVVTAKQQPVADAAVVWMRADGWGDAPGDYLVKSGKDGSYEVPDPDLWATSLVIAHPDFALLEADPHGIAHDMIRWPSSLSHELQTGGSIEGSVLEESTGRAVRGATLSIRGWPLAKSGARGEFLIRHVAYGWQDLVARTDALVGIAKPTGGGLVVRTRPVRTLAGVVRDAKSHQPIVGAAVMLHGDLSGESLVATSDARGQYAFPSLAPARYGLYVSRKGYTPAAPRRESDAIDLRMSLALHKDFDLVKLRRLRGRVQDEQGRPIDDAFVAWGDKGAPNAYLGYGARDVLDQGGAACRTAPDGSFDLAVPAEGRKTAEGAIKGPLLVLKRGYAAGRLEPGTLEAARPVVVTLTRGVEMKGRVSAADGTPIPDVEVSIVQAGPFAAVLLEPRLSESFSAAGWTKSDAAGRFSARVHPTHHRVAFRKNRYSPKTVQSHDPTTGASLDVVLDPAAELRGDVVRHDGSGVAGVLVSAQLASGMSAGTATTAADGSFAIEDLSPGPYELLAFSEEAGIYLARSVEAPVSGVRFELGPTGTIYGRVVEAASGQPIPHFRLMLEPGAGDDETERSARGRRQEVSDARGEFVVAEVPLGEISLTVRAEGHISKRLEGLSVLSDGQADGLEIALDAGATIRGRVKTKQGEAIPDVAVSIADRGHGQRASTESDERGGYELRGIPLATVTLEFRCEGFVTLRRVVNAAEATRVDATLSRGLSLRGVVVSNAVGVPDVSVAASSSALDAEHRSTSTDEQGRFTLEGLAPGRYSIRARSEDHGEAEIEDVDVEEAGPLRLVLERSPTAVLTGTVTGLSQGDDVVMAMVSVDGESGNSVQTRVDADGTFRFEDAPAGRAKVRGYFSSLAGATRSSRANDLILVAGVENQTVIEFHNDVVITGVVTRGGDPLANAFVSFQSADADEGRATASTDAAGQYEVGGLEPGQYRVDVSGAGISFDTECSVAGSGQFDIDVTGATLRGTTVAAADGTAVSGVEVSFWRQGARENRPVESVTSNGRGEFAALSLREGHYRLLTMKAGYGQEIREIDLRRNSAAEIVLELSAAEGIALKVVDARNERPLDATIVVRDLTKRIVANHHAGAELDGTLEIALAAGHYLLSTSADGYGTATLPVTSPGRDLRVGLTPGGTLVVESERDLRGRIRLVRPDGEEYVRCWCNGIADIEVKGRRTTVPNITPGNYTLELVDDGGRAPAGQSVEILEGQLSRVVID